jgi:hypothetical protein
MQDQAENPKLDVIRKLLAKADGAATTAEAEAYTAKAVTLMARHGIDAALLDATAAKKETIESRRITITGPYSRDKADLLTWLGGALRCRTVLHSQAKRIIAVTVVGFASDLERLELLYTSLLLQATRQLVHVAPPWSSQESTAAYRRTWFQGFNSVVARRVREAETQAVEETPEPTGTSTPGVALVLADRKAQVDVALDALFPTLGTAKRRKLSGTGRRAGAQAGLRADIGSKQVGGERRAVRA